MRTQSASLFDFYEPLPIRVEVSVAPLTSAIGRPQASWNEAQKA